MQILKLICDITTNKEGLGFRISKLILLCFAFLIHMEWSSLIITSIVIKIVAKDILEITTTFPSTCRDE